MYDSVILIRFQKKISERLKEVARARGEHVSSFARQTIMKELAKLGFLDEHERRAFGISSKEFANEQQLKG